jgi:peroxiredoxin
MAQLRQDYQQFEARNTEIIVVGPEDRPAFRRYWQRQALPFVGLPDPEHTVAGLYGQQVKLLKLGRLPALMLIDKSGNIRYRHYGDSMQDIPDNASLLTLLENLNQEQGEG